MRRAGEEPSEPISLNKNNRYQVEGIRKKYILKNKIQFLIKQINYSEYQNTQEPPKYLEKCDELLEEFRIRLKRVEIAKRTFEHQKD